MHSAENTAHAGRVRSMFGRIAGRYDFLNHFLSLGLDIVWRRRMVRTVRPLTTGRFLDLAAGTLDVALELRRQHPGCTVLALDFALPMLRRGAAKLGAHRHAVQPVQADARALPLPDGCVDAVTIAFGIRNILPRQDAHAEALRVLAPGGRLCILEFGTASRPIWKGLYNFYLDRLLPLAGRVVSGDAAAYRYLADTIRAFPPAEGLADELRAAGFVNVAHTPLSGGIVTIHVAEKPARTGDVFVVGGRPHARAGEPQPDAAPKTSAAPARTARPKAGDTPAQAPAPGLAARRAAANLQAGLDALGSATGGPEPAPSAPAAPKAKAKAKADTQAKPAPKAKAKPKADAKPKAKAKAKPAPKADAKAKPKAKPAPKGDAKGQPKAKAKPAKAPKAPAKAKGKGKS
ncbi:ubiquinone/menaquinone biosynthesis methyltransferase [Desulfocurvus sp.]|uniref:ubiquinone/menaquinone biosynthesis methyltransferase n=1 Tax=Desulfocurvus sp. TaxID=2871698 RepID=UPI0025BCC37A|nr:ubiquinone/menaquinone biosynthesis methyltransferase [Desulfocurvus sp.]MCK9239575.1 ubiquinone/menaquinone biosynthesis methyltransferase [Desulfocurvus sp.]